MDISERDQVRIRVWTEDNAGRHFQGPAGGSLENAARYTSESWLNRNADPYPLPTVWRLVRALLEDRPELLHLTPHQRKQQQEDRAARCEAAFARADEAFRAGDPDAAVAALNEGEATDPDHRIGWATWAQLRQFVHERTNNKE